MKLLANIQHAVVDNFTGFALSLHDTPTEADLAIPRKPPYEQHPGFRTARVLVTIEELTPIPPVQQLHLPMESNHVAHA